MGLWSKTVRYLDILLDFGLRWGPAVSDRVRRALSSFKVLYPLINCKSTLHLRFKILLYNMCARLSVWAAASRSQLDRVQDKFLRVILNARIDTRITIYIMRHMEFIDQVIAKLLAKAFKHEHNNL